MQNSRKSTAPIEHASHYTSRKENCWAAAKQERLQEALLHTSVGVCVGLNDGSSVVVGGSVVGTSVGVSVGLDEGFSVGVGVGAAVFLIGLVGSRVGAGVFFTALVGVRVGAPVLGSPSSSVGSGVAIGGKVIVISLGCVVVVFGGGGTNVPNGGHVTRSGIVGSSVAKAFLGGGVAYSYGVGVASSGAGVTRVLRV